MGGQVYDQVEQLHAQLFTNLSIYLISGELSIYLSVCLSFYLHRDTPTHHIHTSEPIV